MVQGAPSTSSAPTPSQEDLDSLAQVLSAGKRHLICNEPEKALDLFVELCERLSNFYGEKSNECAEAYLYYGKTLLELARLENGVLGNAVKEASDEIEPETAEEEEGEKGEEEQTIETAPSGSSEGKDKVETTEQEKPDIEEGAEGEEEEEDADDDANDTQDVSNMELSWEMLELTCEICNRMISENGDKLKKAKELLAEAKYGLAEISMEQEQYEMAVTDFTSCLEIHNEILENKLDRRFAEVHYNIGLAQSFDKKFEEAQESFKKAVGLLGSRREMLQKNVDSAAENSGKGKASSEMTDWNKEIKDLDELIIEMNAKIEDAKDMKQQADEAIKTMKEKAKDMFGSLSSITTGGFDTGFDSGFDAPTSTKTEEVVHDISHKIRSTKRSSDDDGPVDCKKVKTDDEQTATNGDKSTTTNTSVNGAETNGKHDGNDVAAEQKPTSIGA